MEQYVGMDAHKRFSQFAVLDEKGRVIKEVKVEHNNGNIKRYLSGFPQGTQVAVECVGNWYWFADEIESAGCEVLLTQAGKAKLMMGHVNKTDKLDAIGLAKLLRNGTLPTVWLPPGELRDEREIPRTRMKFSRIRTMLKNRIHATFDKYNIRFEGVSDIFEGEGRKRVLESRQLLPEETRNCVTRELAVLSEIEKQIKDIEGRIKAKVKVSEEMKIIDSLPGVAEILAIVIVLETGPIERFPSSENYVSYCGLVPKVDASAGRIRYGKLIKAANHYLKWAFVEAAQSVARCKESAKWRGLRITELYNKVCSRRGHGKAIVAVARQLAEAAYWMLTKRENYKEPGRKIDAVIPKSK